jgi:dienelactone hydrolase
MTSTALFISGSGAQTENIPAIGQQASYAHRNAVRSRDLRLPIQIKGHRYDLEARMFGPVGEGPFPLIVINHGTPVSIRDAPYEKLGFASAALWFASRGYVVVVAMRPGFGSSDGPYLETSGPCSDRNYVHDGQMTADVEAAIVEAASTLPSVDPKRVVVVGQSAGGFGVLALADAPPAGVLGVISFAGGRGGDDHEHICSGIKRLVDAASVFGKTDRLPELWLFAVNDHFFPPQVGHAMFEAYQAGSEKKLTFVDLPSFDGDGHRTFGSGDPSIWAAPVSDFLQEIGAAPRVKQ